MRPASAADEGHRRRLALSSPDSAPLAGRIRPSSAHPRGRGRYSGNEAGEPPGSPYVSLYMQQFGPSTKDPDARQLGRPQLHKSTHEAGVNSRGVLDLPARVETVGNQITQSEGDSYPSAENREHAEKRRGMHVELNRALDDELKRLLFGKNEERKTRSPKGFLPLSRRRSTTLHERASPGAFVEQQAALQEAEKNALDTMIRKQRLALEAAEKALENALSTKYKHHHSNVGAPRPGAAGSRRPNVAAILAGSQKGLPTEDLQMWHQAQGKEAAKDRALRDLEVRFKTEMWETEAARMTALEEMQRDQEQGKSKILSFLIQERDTANEALEQCKEELRIEQQRCAQAESEVTAQNNVNERMTWLVQSFVRELKSVGKSLSKEINEQKMQDILEASRGPQVPQKNRELWVLGEVKARQLQKENQRLLSELEQANKDIEPLIAKATARLTQQIVEHEKTIEELEVRVDGYKREIRNLTKNSKVISAEDRIKIELEDFENHVINVETMEKLVRNRNKQASASSRVATFGRYLHFDLGLHRLYGKPPLGNDDVLFKMMELEFEKDQGIVTSNYGGIKTDVRTEWLFVVDPEHPSVKQEMQENPNFLRGSGEHFPQREPRPLSAFITHPLRDAASLTKAEVVGLRLYTGPAYCVINNSLRAVLAAEANEDGQADSDKKKVKYIYFWAWIENYYVISTVKKYLEKVDQGEFTAVASAINSGLKKLARVTPLTPGRRLYRGISNMAFESRLLAEGRTPGENSFVEAGFSSATPNLSVALQYASGKCATLLEIDTGAIDRGAQLKWISQFPVEDEHTILPLSNFEIVKARTMSRQALQQEVSLQRNQRIFATLLRLRECPQLKSTFNTLQLLDNIFEEIDNDSNGDLTKGEFQKYVKRSKESVAPTPGDDVAETQQLKSLLPDRFEDMCNKMDFGDKDGKISRSEFFEYYMDFLLKSSLSVENGTQTVFSLIWQMSPKNVMPSQCDVNHSVFDMSIEQFQRLLESLNITVTEAETRQLFDFIDDDQDGMLNLAELSRAVAGRGADGGRKLDGLKRSIKEARLKQISEESELYENQAKSLNSKFDEYINVFSIKLNSNLKAQDAWESLDSRRACVVDFFTNLKLEAQNVSYCGKEIIKELDEGFRKKVQNVNGKAYLPYSDWASVDYLQICTFRRAIEDLLAIWTKVLRDEKVRTENQIAAADAAIEQRLQRMANDPSSERADRQGADSLLEGACKLMALCEPSNDEDAKRFWPIVEEAFKKLSLYFQYTDGADGLITLMRIIYEKALVDNSVLNARRVMEQVVTAACNEYKCIPLLFSDDCAIQEVASLLGPDSDQPKWLQGLKSVQPKEIDLEGVAKYTQKFVSPVKTHERGIDVFRKVQGPKFEADTRAKFGEVGVVTSIFVSLKTLPSSSQAVADACTLVEGLVDSRPMGTDSSGERDIILELLEKEIPALLDLLEVHQTSEKSVAEFLWILNQICERQGQKSRAIDRLLEFGANTKVKACEKRFAGHSLVLNNCSLLLAKIKQRQEQR